MIGVAPQTATVRLISLPSLVTEPPNAGIIHYETHGRGRPVLFLHGWLGSWALWRPTIEALGQQYKTYSIDFWGFGESKLTDVNLESFRVDTFVAMVDQFMDKLGIPKAAVVGHSMGGTVALSMAIQHPDKIVKACCIGSPINGNSLNLLLKLSGVPAFAWLAWRFPPLLKMFLKVYSRFMAKDGKQMSDWMTRDVSHVTMESFFQSIGTLRKTNLTEEIKKISVPTMGMYGKRDIIVRPKQREALKAGVPHAQIVYYTDAGHFPMLDTPEKFLQDLSDFLRS